MLGAEAEIVEAGEVRLGYIGRRVLGQGRGSGLRWEARGRFGYIRRACYSRRRGLWQRYGGQIRILR